VTRNLRTGNGIHFLPLSRNQLLSLLLPCPDGYLLRLTFAACNADALRAAFFANRKHNRENPILEFRLDIVGIDRPGEGDRPFKRTGDNFPQEPVVSLPMAFRPATLRLLRLLSSALLLTLLLRLPTLHLTLGLALMLFLMAIATANRQAVLINREFNIFRSHAWERNIHLVAIRRLTDIHRCHQRWCARHQTGRHNALFE
jgi:hypothetical protein